jgi:hypothetical protein
MALMRAGGREGGGEEEGQCHKAVKKGRNTLTKGEYKYD